jgi:hypothetical protein
MARTPRTVKQAKANVKGKGCAKRWMNQTFRRIQILRANVKGKFDQQSVVCVNVKAIKFRFRMQRDAEARI